MTPVVPIRGKQLFVEIAGPADAPPVLFLHGGPGGARGSYEYMLFQRELLSTHLRIIAIDQRGVLRSEALADDEAFSIQDLIDDCEALRRELGLAKWSVIGHSFGGYLALLYAAQHPQSIERLVFDSPAFDLELSSRSVMRAAALEFARSGDQLAADKCLALSKESPVTEETQAAYAQMMGQLGDRVKNLYHHGEDKDFIDRAMEAENLPQELLERGNAMAERVFAEGRIYESVLPYLDSLMQPALLIRGASDPVCCDVQAERFHRDVMNGCITVFEKSGHCPYAEEPVRYAEVVTEFLRA